ncbi:hypothetical protein B0T21DRAFT_408866 [Apiosordaria backusii]|uniref:Uncharacterized protein n=1 Tax=Apiosordaria backusii TaxID=314023 RepID=A0AA40EMF6_9PEZI|nr:hypothetical protein B0T21DRAFT_408866 [Apiosordaria backusii]
MTPTYSKRFQSNPTAALANKDTFAKSNKRRGEETGDGPATKKGKEKQEERVTTPNYQQTVSPYSEDGNLHPAYDLVVAALGAARTETEDVLEMYYHGDVAEDDEEGQALAAHGVHSAMTEFPRFWTIYNSSRSAPPSAAIPRLPGQQSVSHSSNNASLLMSDPTNLNAATRRRLQHSVSPHSNDGYVLAPDLTNLGVSGPSFRSRQSSASTARRQQGVSLHSHDNHLLNSHPTRFGLSGASPRTPRPNAATAHEPSMPRYNPTGPSAQGHNSSSGSVLQPATTGYVSEPTEFNSTPSGFGPTGLHLINFNRNRSGPTGFVATGFGTAGLGTTDFISTESDPTDFITTGFDLTDVHASNLA